MLASTGLFDSVFQFLKMVKNIRVEIVFVRVGQGILHDAVQLIQGDVVVLNQKNDVFEICFNAAVQFTQGNAVWIGNVDFQISILTNADTAVCAPVRQGDKTLKGDWFHVDFQFPGNLHNGSVQFAWMHIIADKVNIDCQAWTSQQGQCAATDQDQLGVGRDAFSDILEDGLDFRVVQEI